MSSQEVVVIVCLFLSAALRVASGFLIISPTDTSSLLTTVIPRRHNTTPPPHHHTRGRRALRLLNSANNNNNNDKVTTTTTTIAEAERLLARAKAIREELGNNNNSTNQQVVVEGKQRIQSEFSLPSSSGSNNNYRLYLDIGREAGTWMDPRWGASGRRIECTIDVSFSSSSSLLQQQQAPEEEEEEELASEEITTGLIQTVTTKSSKLSPVFKLQHAPFARLRSGFDKMKIYDGGYCIESASKSSTIRFCLSVSGTATGSGSSGSSNSSTSSSYGDVSIPEGKLYFALPYFGTTLVQQPQSSDTDSNDDVVSQPIRIMSISKKEGTICVKQFGWNTGWRREESRILGVFRAVPLEEAKRRDKF